MKMLTKKIVDCIYVNKIIEQDMIAVCEYGVELVLAGIVNIIVILFVSVLLHSMLYGIIFLLILISTRAFMGGYHATTHIRCNISMVCIYIISLLMLNIKYDGYVMLVHILTLTGYIVISRYAPLENSNKSLSEQQKKKYNKISQIAYIVLFVIAMVVNYKDQELSLYINIIMVIVVVLLIIGKEKNIYDEEKGIKSSC